MKPWCFFAESSSPKTKNLAGPLKAARRTRETYVGPWLPEPLVAPSGTQTVEMSESLSLAFLRLLESLSPAERDELKIVADQFGVPNWSRALAQATAELVARGVPLLSERAGVYHLSAAGSASWFEFARAIIGNKPHPRVVPIATSDYPTAARRPAYAVLGTSKLEAAFGIRLEHWRDLLAACLASGR